MSTIVVMMEMIPGAFADLNDTAMARPFDVRAEVDLPKPSDLRFGMSTEENEGLAWVRVGVSVDQRDSVRVLPVCEPMPLSI